MRSPLNSISLDGGTEHVMLPFQVTEWLTSCGFLLFLFEYIAMLTLRSPLAVVGIPFLSTQLAGPHVPRALHPGSRPIIAAVRCRVLPNGTLLFRTIPSLVSFSWHSPFPLKAVITVGSGSSVVTGALPFGSILFFAGVAGTFRIEALFVVGFLLVCIALERQRTLGVARTVLGRLSAEVAAV